MGESLYNLCAQWFSGRAGSDMSMIHILPQHVLTASTLVGAVSGDGEATARAKCELELLHCSVTNTTLFGLIPSC